MDTAKHSATIRPQIILPSMPDEVEAAATYKSINLQRSRVEAGELIFEQPDGFYTAMRQGFFLVENPVGFDSTRADEFARHFYESRRGDELDEFRGFSAVAVPGDYQGYFDREYDQWENFYIEQGNWGLLPSGVAAVGRQMADLGIEILRAVLGRLQLPEKDWAEATGGLSEYRGHQMLAFNHFRSQKRVRGTKFHRDSGWVTILRSTEPGLLALIDGELWSIRPEPGYLIANFGSSIEVLTERLPSPVRANVHGVVRTERKTGQDDRWSYVVFLDSDLSGTIYRYEEGERVAVQSVADFAVQEVGRTYDGNDAEL
jgi:hypothetical protein